MSVPANGITADVFRDMMPPYHLSADLLQATLGALPPPPPYASAAWRQAHLTRLISEITKLHPADAGQARTAADILILRELADTVANRAHAPEVTVQEICRLGRAVAELARTAGVLARGLQRTQQKPVPFYGTVIEDEVDIAALDRAWCDRSLARRGADPAQGQPAPEGRGEPSCGRQPQGTAVSTADTTADTTAGTAAPVRGLAARESGDTSGVTETGSSACPAVTAGQDGAALAEGQDGAVLAATAGDGGAAAMAGRQAPAGLGPACVRPDVGPQLGSVVTRLDQGPGWTLDVVRARSGGEAGAAPAAAHAAAPGAVSRVSA